MIRNFISLIPDMIFGVCIIFKSCSEQVHSFRINERYKDILNEKILICYQLFNALLKLPDI